HHLGGAADELRGGSAGRARVGKTALPRSCIGIARVDDERAYLRGPREVLAAARHRRRTETILGEDACRPRPGREAYEQKVVARPVLDARRSGAEDSSRNGQQLFGERRGVIDRPL